MTAIVLALVGVVAIGIAVVAFLDRPRRSSKDFDQGHVRFTRAGERLVRR